MRGKNITKLSSYFSVYSKPIYFAKLINLARYIHKQAMEKPTDVGFFNNKVYNLLSE